MTQLTIVVEAAGGQMEFNDKDADACIVAMFNPSRLGIGRSARWEDQQAAKRDNPELQFTGADPSTLNVELFFDTYDTEDLTKQSVRVHTDRLLHLTTVEQHGGKHRPPVCRLQWGQQAVFFQGVLTQLETQFTMFMEDGTPVRATNRCTFKQWRSNVADLKKQDLLSADVAKVWRVREGQNAGRRRGARVRRSARMAPDRRGQRHRRPAGPRPGPATDAAGAARGVAARLASHEAAPPGQEGPMTARDGFDTLSPEYSVQVSGAPLPQEALADLIALTVLEDVDAASMFTLTLAGWDTVEMKAKWIDDALFREGNPVEIGIGYRDRTEPLMSGEITGVEPAFGSPRRRR
ncbi:MAG: hypothetical protein MZW92_29790 [Comamonadaceae bacterium]|nr:hypothetical protein [Comamonadaceae bacterium]